MFGLYISVFSFRGRQSTGVLEVFVLLSLVTCLVDGTCLPMIMVFMMCRFSFVGSSCINYAI